MAEHAKHLEMYANDMKQAKADLGISVSPKREELLQQLNETERKIKWHEDLLKTAADTVNYLNTRAMPGILQRIRGEALDTIDPADIERTFQEDVDVDPEGYDRK